MLRTLQQPAVWLALALWLGQFALANRYQDRIWGQRPRTVGQRATLALYLGACVAVGGYILSEGLVWNGGEVTVRAAMGLAMAAVYFAFLR